MSKRNKAVYILRGSEDGNLGVFKSVETAWLAAINYVSEDNNAAVAAARDSGVAEGVTTTVVTSYDEKTETYTFADVQADLKVVKREVRRRQGRAILTFEGDGYGSATIESFILGGDCL